MRTYMSTKEIAAKVRAELKKELPAWKFSVRMKSFSMGSSITISLMSGPEEVLADERYGGYAQLNQFDFKWKEIRQDNREKLVSNGYSLTPKAFEVFDKAVAILSADHWDESDAMVDYFSCNFYMHVEVGQWDRPYQVKG